MECTVSPKIENDLLNSIWEALQRSRASRVETEAEHLEGIKNEAMGANGEVPSGYPKTEAGVDHSIYIGQQYDTESNLSYLNARYYDPIRGEFLSQDPVFLSSPSQQVIQDPQSLNAYSYSEDNPITKSDPSGRGLLDYPLALGIAGVAAYGDYLQAVSPLIAEDAANFNSSLSKHDYSGAALAGLGIGADVLGGAEFKEAAGAADIAKSAQLGREGEAASGIVKNTQRITSSSGTASYRIPDELDTVANTIGEVKNVAYQSLTNQLQDFLTYAQQNSAQFTLYVRENTQFSQNLQSALEQANAIVKTINNSK